MSLNMSPKITECERDHLPCGTPLNRDYIYVLNWRVWYTLESGDPQAVTTALQLITLCGDITIQIKILYVPKLPSTKYKIKNTKYKESLLIHYDNVGYSGLCRLFTR
jgi:hypothetical protein